MLKLFRAASFIEGMSYLVILCVTIGLISRDFVSVLGMTHGALSQQLPRRLMLCLIWHCQSVCRNLRLV